MFDNQSPQRAVVISATSPLKTMLALLSLNAGMYTKSSHQHNRIDKYSSPYLYACRYMDSSIEEERKEVLGFTLNPQRQLRGAPTSSPKFKPQS